MKKLQTIFGLLSACLFTTVGATPFEVTISNNGPDGGVFFTPLWVGFHDGTFDTYNLGEATSSSLETLAELGDTSAISADFGD